jgi:sialidase-1
MLKATDFERGLIVHRPDQMYGWPGIVRVNEREFLVIASERKYHICPFGREVIIRSTDGGKTWGLPQEIFNSELDDRDGTIQMLPDGTLVAAWFTSAHFADPDYGRPEFKARSDRLTDRIRDEVAGDWLIRSFDGGSTWETVPHRMPLGGAEHIGPFVLSNGALACFGYERVEDTVAMFFYTSKDQGQTWDRLGRIPCREFAESNFSWHVSRGEQWELRSLSINERALLELSPDRFLVLFRNSKHGRLTECRSDDGGKTWSELRLTPIVGKPAHLLRLHSGEVLCSYGHRADPWSVRAVISRDDGETWDMDNLITIDHWDDHPDMGYPTSIEISPGEILTVYYCSRQPIWHLSKQETTYKRGSTPEGILYARFRLK